ncbi:unnamed protein product [Bursaphelenchus xylophilus]|uniref:(pine wood nematode) hypothetical protein n=1 Tax=Bursaphelenchus xylophilus TaxID=6326 RepID=A0A1I7RHK8_BURXY|nr:unnamed protein product [Bursaphelenchus xylophilus]CAG9115637.1 unnamed protein product [Bursaphelenchus xylophilus]
MSTSALAVVPPVCPISAAGGKSKHRLVNQSAVKLAYKVKCTNNSNYSVNKVYGFVDVGEEGGLEITRIAGKPKADKLIVQYVQPAPDHTDPKQAFEPGYQSEVVGETVVKLSAAE